MLHSFESSVVGFESSWKTEKIVSDGQCQTSSIESKHVKCSTLTYKDVAIQTMQPNVEFGKLPALCDTRLREITNMMLKELSSVKYFNIFKGYDPFEDDDFQEPKAKLIQKILPPDFNKDLSFDKHTLDKASLKHIEIPDNSKFSVVSLCWSQTGNSLAVGYGLTSHENWCLHSGFVIIFMKSGTRDTYKQNVELRLPSCTSVTSFHPMESSLFAAATVSGEVCVWNLQQQNLNSCHGQHSNKVSSILWLSANQAQQFIGDTAIYQVLATGSVDGIITIWSINKTTPTISKLKKYELNGSAVGLKVAPDITCMDFLNIPSGEYQSESLKEDIFIVGCRTGEIVLYQTSAVKDMKEKNPVIQSLESHGGCVLSLSFSTSYNRTLLLTLGADLEVRLYNVPQSFPLQIICLETQLSSVVWVPGCDRLIVGAVGQCKKGTGDILQIFDVKFGTLVFSADGFGEIKDPSSSNYSQHGFIALASNNKNWNIFSCGDIWGQTYIWSLPLHRHNLSHSQFCNCFEL